MPNAHEEATIKTRARHDAAKPPSADLGSSKNRRSDIQGLRALAVLAVVVFHAGLPVPGGFTGVDVFFVISGFVISLGLLRQLARTSQISLMRFYVRRIRRLMPPLAIVLVVTLAASALLQSPFGFQQDTAAVGIGAALWSANIAIYGRVGGYFDRAADELPLLHTWSLSVEEQFYLVFPLLLLVLWRLSRGRIRLAAVGLGLVCALSFGFAVLTSYDLVSGIDNGAAFAFYMSPSRAWEFGAGALLALLAHAGYSLPKRFAPVAAASGLAGLIGCMFWVDRSMAFPGWVALAPVALTVLLIAGATAASPTVTVLSSRPMTWVGDLSYGWYLWHWPFIVFARLIWPASVLATCLAAAASLLPAWLSYRFVEEPIRAGSFGRRLSTARSRTPHGAGRVAVACMLTPLLLFVAFGYVTNQHWGNERIAHAAAQTESFPVGYANGCHEGGPVQDRNLAECTWNAEYSDSVYLVGDSNAGMYADGLVEATAQAHQRLIVGARSNCPFINASVNGAGNTADCDDYVQQTQDWLSRQAPATVVLAAAADQITDDGATITDPATGELADTDEKKAEVWSNALSSTINTLRSAGHRVIVIGVVPHFYAPQGGYWSTVHCAMIDFVESTDACGAEQPLSEADRDQQFALAAQAEAAASSGATLLDVRSAICTDGLCQTVRDDQFIYREGKHISRTMSEQLAPQLAAALAT